MSAKVFTDEEVESLAREWTDRVGATVQGLIRHVEAEALKRSDTHAVSRARRLLEGMKPIGKVRPAAHWNEPSDS